eukprot:scaffold100556_cov31-Prasinocladus_malaysianus.AAC.1
MSAGEIRLKSGPCPDEKWPRLHVAVFKDVAPPALCDAMAEEASAVAECPNFWVPRDDIERGLDDGARTLGEVVVAMLYDRVMKSVLKGVEWTGAEWWTQ